MLDAWALLAMLRGERAAPRVRDVIASERTIASSVNLGEVMYWTIRDHGQARGARLIERIRQLVEVEDPDWPLVSAAAALKARGGISYADAFCVATAQRHQLPIWTGDPEIVRLDGEVQVIDLREDTR